MKTAAASLLIALSAVLHAADEPAAPAQAPAAVEPEVLKVAGHAPLKLHSGHIVVAGGIAGIDLPPDLRWVADADARYLVETVWRNLPDPSVVGVVWPTGDDQQWALIVSWDPETGHVKDDDAGKVDPDGMLKSMKEETAEESKERAAKGLGSIELLAWTEQPSYNAAEHKLTWGTDLRFDGTSREVNYCVRVLGARGNLVMNAIDDIARKQAVMAASKRVLAATAFTNGNRYQDFREGIDKTAAVGIVGLIAGGLIAKKVGLFVILLKFGKILIIPFVLAGSWIVGRVRAARAAMAGRRAASGASGGGRDELPPRA